MIHVFKTSVKTKKSIRWLKPKLNALALDLKWNFDLEDCDHILRIDSAFIEPHQVINLLQSCNFECQELE